MTREEQVHYLEELYRTMSPHLARYALAVLSDPSDAEDAVQEVFRIACTKLDTMIQSQNPQGWLVNTLKHVLQNQQRAKARYIACLCAFMTARPTASNPAESSEVDLLYQDLVSSEDYLLLKRLYLDGSSILEIAEIDGIPYETCKKRVQRARTRLQKYMQEHDFL